MRSPVIGGCCCRPGGSSTKFTNPAKRLMVRSNLAARAEEIAHVDRETRCEEMKDLKKLVLGLLFGWVVLGAIGIALQSLYPDDPKQAAEEALRRAGAAR